MEESKNGIVKGRVYIPAQEEVAVDAVVQQIKDESNQCYAEVVELKIETPNEFNNAVKISGKIGGLKDKIAAYYSPKKKAAHEEHKKICKEEKDALEIPNRAEKLLNGAIKTYLDNLKQQAETRSKEFNEELEKQIQGYLEEATLRQKEKDFVGAEILLKQAELCEKSKNAISAELEPDVTGKIKDTCDYEITIENLSAVPVELAGVLIRPVDEKAVKSLIKKSNGTIVIPGIKYEKVTSIKVKKTKI